MTAGAGPRRALALGLLAAVLFSLATPGSKLLLAGAPPLRLAGLLYGGAALALLPLALASPWPRVGRRTLARVLGVVVFGGILAPALFLLGLARAPSQDVSLWLGAEPVLTAVLAALFFHEHFGWREGASVALVAGGAAMIAGSTAPWSAALLVLAACLAWALDNNLSSLIEGVRPAQLVAVKGLAAAAVNLGASAYLERGEWAAPRGVVAALALGGVAYGASLALYVAASQQLGAIRSQLVFASAPFLGIFLSWAALAERPGLRHVPAIALVASGLVLLLTGRHEHEHAHEARVHSHGHRHDDGHHDHAHDGLDPGTWHVHEHAHEAVRHAHAHVPDMHHRHEHRGG